MAMKVSLTSLNNPLLRHLSPFISWVFHSSRFSSSVPSVLVPCCRTLLSKVASAQGNVGYSTTIVFHGFQHRRWFSSGNEPSDVRANLREIYEKVLVVDNVPAAKHAVAMLLYQCKHLVHSCSTEVSRIEVKDQTPVEHGELICFSICFGSEPGFGFGKSCLWVDVLGEKGKDVLAEFKPYFEDSSIRKVWHNYSVQSHTFRNHGIKISGFHADTMHMALLCDSGRHTECVYSLEALTRDPKVLGATHTKEEVEFLNKILMKTIFEKRKLKKDGSEGKIVVIPPVEELQQQDREAWISYSSLNAISKLKLYQSMRKKLMLKEWRLDGKLIAGRTLLDIYHVLWKPFAELLVKMEAEGILVDKEYLSEIEKVGKAEQEVAASRFKIWASKYCPNAANMNVGSYTQLRHLFFGGSSNRLTGELLENVKTANIPKVGKIELHRISDIPLYIEKFNSNGWPSVGLDALETLAGKVSGEYDNEDATQSKKDVAAENSVFGTAYLAFGGGEKEKKHVKLLLLYGKYVSSKDGRVHFSFCINTKYGRLSARRPYLQKLPPSEKDRYKIRKAFTASSGNTLIVADYGQLELRILAHLAGCKSMIEDFGAGGDFHSKTAMNMFPHIREAVENGEVLLEWHPQPGEDKPSRPLLKDTFAFERRKAKMLNFSIANGETANGLSRVWKVPRKEAQLMVDLWYYNRQEVRKWQEMLKKEAMEGGFVLTLLGRECRLPAYDSHADNNDIQRAAINTLVQGSAADVAMCAMLEISENQRLTELGWRLVLQFRDEVILEGPIESAEIAKGIVVGCMSKPFKGENILSVDLSVDAKCARNWYDAIKA